MAPSKYAIPTKQEALKVMGAGAIALQTSATLPELRPDELLVQVAHVSINHVDGKAVELSPQVGATCGVDFSGVVVAVGSAVGACRGAGERPISVGQRVFGAVLGNNALRPDNGAFAQYVATPATLTWCVPHSMELAPAATLGAALATVGLSLFNYLGLHLPASVDTHASRRESGGKPTVLIHGGGTATGVMAIQVLKAAGYPVVTTCSDSSAPLALRMGAKAWFDYKSPTCGSDIREYTQNGLTLALDCVVNLGSMTICYEALGSAGGRYLALDPFTMRGHTRRSVVPDWICAPTQFGEAIQWSPPYDLDPRPEDREHAERWYPVAQSLLDQGLIEPFPWEERTGGLACVREGIESVHRGDIAHRRLTYCISADL